MINGMSWDELIYVIPIIPIFITSTFIWFKTHPKPKDDEYYLHHYFWSDEKTEMYLISAMIAFGWPLAVVLFIILGIFIGYEKMMIKITK